VVLDSLHVGLLCAVPPPKFSVNGAGPDAALLAALVPSVGACALFNGAVCPKSCPPAYMHEALLMRALSQSLRR